MRFFLFFLASAMAAGPLDKIMRASVVDFGSVEGSEGIVADVEVVLGEGGSTGSGLFRELLSVAGGQRELVGTQLHCLRL